MKNKILSCLFGFGLLVISACSNNNGTASAESKSNNNRTASAESKLNVVIKSEFDTDNLDKIDYIADTKNSYIGRYVDCKAGVTIYTHSSEIAVVPNDNIHKDLLEEKCK